MTLKRNSWGLAILASLILRRTFPSRREQSTELARDHRLSSTLRRITMKIWCWMVLILLYFVRDIFGMNAEELLTEDLLSPRNYNRLLRPAETLDKKVFVQFDLLLSQLIGVNEREQYMVTKVWLPQTWTDQRLSWKPEKFGNITKLQMPSFKIWLPDIVLYNNADGEYEASLQSNAIVLSNGTVSWMPPAIYKSACNIQVSKFPFDEQNCSMNFRSWTYTRRDMELHLSKNEATLDDFTPSGEWDIIETPGSSKGHGGEDAHQEITYSLIIKRKPLFYTVNLIIPCILITFLAILVFYTPSDCGEKMTLCISVLLALTVFLLLLSKMVPPTSLDVPLIGKYLMFTMVLVTLSIVMSVCVLNVHHRTASTHEMPRWVQRYLLCTLPRILMMYRPIDSPDERSAYVKNMSCIRSWMRILTEHNRKAPVDSPHKRYFVTGESEDAKDECKYGIHLNEVSGSCYVKKRRNKETLKVSPEFQKAMKCVEFITEHLKSRNTAQTMSEDWKFVAMVIDRMLFYFFILSFLLGTFGIFIQPFM